MPSAPLRSRSVRRQVQRSLIALLTAAVVTSVVSPAARAEPATTPAAPVTAAAAPDDIMATPTGAAPADQTTVDPAPAARADSTLRADITTPADSTQQTPPPVDTTETDTEPPTPDAATSVADVGTDRVAAPAPADGATAAAAVEAPGVFAFGDNSWGQLGTGSFAGSAYVPVAMRTDGPLAGKTVTQAVSAFQQWTCLIASGDVYCLGNPSSGTFGNPTVDGASEPIVTPVAVYVGGSLRGTEATDIAATYTSACAVAAGAVSCWGSDDNGLLGNGGPEANEAVPVPIDQSHMGGRSVQQVSLGQRAGCLAADGKAYCWGSNQFAQLGTASAADSAIPVPVDDSGALDGRYVTDVAVGYGSACALADGRVYCWGETDTAGTGSDAFEPIRTPAPVDTSGVLAGKTVTALATSGNNFCVLADGHPYCWGITGAFVLGTAEATTTAYSPVRVQDTPALAGTVSTQLVGGSNYFCVVASGNPVCWGVNVFGRLGIGSDARSSLPAAVRTDGVLAGRTVTGLGADWTGASTYVFTGPAPITRQPTPAPDPGPSEAAHRPVAALDSVIPFGASATVQGWAFDPDAPASPVTIRVTDRAPDGTTSTLDHRTGERRDDIETGYSYVSDRTGFAFRQLVRGVGAHTLCVRAVNTGRGSDVDLGCRTVDVPPTGGSVTPTNTRTGVITASGWAGDPDHPSRTVDVELQVTSPDGTTSTQTTTTGVTRADVLAATPWAGFRAGWTVDVPVDRPGDWRLCPRVKDADSTAFVPAGCSTYTVRNSFGAFDELTVVRVPGGKARMVLRGWTIDPNMAAGARNWWTYNVDGGPWSGAMTTGVIRKDVAEAFPGQGDNHGFVLTFDESPGRHTYCVVARPTGGGSGETSLGCKTVDIPAAVPDPAGTYVGLVPNRIVDTRLSLGATGRIGRDGEVTLTVTGQGGVPASGVGAVVLNVTAVDPTAPGHLTAYRSGSARPDVSNVNFAAGQTVPDLVTVPVGADGKVVLHHGGIGSVDVVVDTVGWYRSGTATAAGALTQVTPQRVLDTRDGTGGTRRLASDASVRVPVGRIAGIPAGAASAVVATLTVVNPSAPGNLAVYPAGLPRPATSNLNFATGQTVATMVIVPVAADGSLTLTNGSTGTSDVLLDVVGYFRSGTPTALGAFVALPPARVADSRVGLGIPAVLGRDGTALLQIAGARNVSSYARSVVATVTGVDATAPGNLAVYGQYADRPGISNVNFGAGGTSANTVLLTTYGPDALIRNNSTGSTQVLVDVVGYFLG